MKVLFLPVIAGILFLTACNPPSLYHWGPYEPAVYKLMKSPADLEKFGSTLKEVIENAEAEGKVPPGLYAEYGYVLAQTGHTKEAVAFYEKEKLRWPESKVLMDKMIANCSTGTVNRTAVQPVAVPVAGTAVVEGK